MTDPDPGLPVHLNAAGYAALIDRPTYAAPERVRLPEPADAEPAPALTEADRQKRLTAIRERVAMRRTRADD